MAKQAASEVRPNHVQLGDAMGLLHAELRRLVEEDKVVCPRSTVHDQETDFDSRLADATHAVIRELSGDTGFLIYRTIEDGQTSRALRRYLGLPADAEGKWQQAFDSNPQHPLTRPRLWVRIPVPEAFIKDDRSRKARIHDFHVQQASLRVGQPTLNFVEARARQLAGVVDQVYRKAVIEFLQRYREWLQGNSPHLSNSSTDAEVVDFLNALGPPSGYRLLCEYAALTGQAHISPDERYWGFFESRDFDSIFFYDIFCSLEAGLVVYEPARKPKPSDAYDFAALASVLPYVDIVTTDSAMKNMLVKLGLHKRYSVEVYSSRLADVSALHERLMHL
jgi:hypothetical protein